MIKAERFAMVEVQSAPDLNGWLRINHAQKESVWLVTFKKHTGTKYLSRSEVLDELLCFGWVDGLTRKLDDYRTMQLISPRQVDMWTQTYRDRAARLENDGRMQQPGRAAIVRSKSVGLWMANLDIDDLVVPSDLALSLQARPPAYTLFMAFAPSHRRNVLGWIATARHMTTRIKRINITVALAAEGKKVPQF